MEYNFKVSFLSGNVSPDMKVKSIDLQSSHKRSFGQLFLIGSLVLCFFWVAVLITYAYFDFENIIRNLSKFAPDGHIEAETRAFLQLLLVPFYCLLVTFLVLKLCRSCTPVPLNYFLAYLFAFSAHYILHTYQQSIFDVPPTEDGFLETATAVLAFVAALFFIISGKLGASVGYLLGLIFLLFALEEVSWGQRIFDLESPAFFSKYNWQKETNIHNFLNPIIRYLYLPAFLIMTSILTSFRNTKLLFSFYQYPSVELLIKLSNKYNLHLILLLCCVVSPSPMNAFDFLEQQFALFGCILSSIYLRAIIAKKSGLVR